MEKNRTEIKKQLSQLLSDQKEWIQLIALEKAILRDIDGEMPIKIDMAYLDNIRKRISLLEYKFEKLFDIK